ncbi:MAG: glycosyl hydrolase family 28-related protein [Kiritimatiellae bacterium]|nr:glycosyl hydrolase family 28-related protein [Kiritimatiellia bacterium]
MSVNIKTSKGFQFTGTVNVRDFGAKGDGRTDDTRAIQAALTAAAEATIHEPDTKEIALHGENSSIPARCGFHHHSTGPEVIIPPGHYVITDALCPEQVDAIRGVGHPWIEQKNPGKDIFHAKARASRQTFRGLIFNGGQSHINLANALEDNGHILIEDCKFYNSKGIAIRMRENSIAAILVIQNCQMVNCEQLVWSFTDFTQMRDCWITGGRSGDGALIVTRPDATFSMDNICGVPLTNGYDQRWIDNYGTLLCNNVRFGGEEGGFTPVVNFAKYQPGTNICNQIVIENSNLVCGLGNNKRKCVIYCEEIPNRLDIRNCNLIGIPPVLVAEKIDPKTYFRAKPGMLKFTFDGNFGELAHQIPALLKKPTINPPPAVEVLNAPETRAAVKKAEQYWRTREPSAKQADEVFDGHRRKTKLGDFVEISASRYKWDASDLVDGSKERCSNYFAVTQMGGQGIIVRKASDRTGAPCGSAYVTIRDVELDLDVYPWLTWRVASNGTPAGLNVKALDHASGRVIRLPFIVNPEFSKDRASGRTTRRPSDTFDSFSYQACNLRKHCGFGGRRTFDLHLYYPGAAYIGSRRTEDTVFAEAGDSMLVEFLRAEKE